MEKNPSSLSDAEMKGYEEGFWNGVKIGILGFVFAICVIGLFIALFFPELQKL